MVRELWAGFVEYMNTPQTPVEVILGVFQPLLVFALFALVVKGFVSALGAMFGRPHTRVLKVIQKQGEEVEIQEV